MGFLFFVYYMDINSFLATAIISYAGNTCKYASLGKNYKNLKKICPVFGCYPYSFYKEAKYFINKRQKKRNGHDEFYKEISKKKAS